AFLDLLTRIAAHVEVVIYAPKATPHYYGDVRRDRSGRPRPRGSGHPLLAAWGAQSREFFDLLLDRDDGGAAEQPLEFEDPGTGTLLHALQSDLLHLHARHRSGDVPPLPLAADDESISVHSAHGPLREMEILRDQLLHALQRDPTLRPSDVLVLLPNVQDHAPYVQAVFGPVQRLLPFHIADRSPAADLPVPALLLRVCALARGRFTAPELLLLLEEPALARRFDIARPDLLALRTWVHRTRIRWGLDGEQRKQDLGLPADDANTWRQGLERLLLGVATGPQDEPVLGLLPAADGSAGRALLLGRFLAFVDAIGATCRALGRPHTLQAWADLVDAFAADLFDPQDDDERHGVLHLQAVARRLRDLHATTALREELQPAAFQAWLQDELQARGDSRGFLCGSITFAALRPMRAVPMRVLAICGLGDGAFPRRGQRPVFDLMQHDRRPGDRSVRDDDRQLFLDAVLAARDRLVLTWVGRSSKDNSECAPSPLVSELLEHLDLAFTPPRGFARARDAVLVDHPLQSFSPRYGAEDPRLFTYADHARGRQVPAAPRPRVPAAADDGARVERVDFADLLRFWSHPPRWYCRNVLDVRFPREDDRDDDAEPFFLHNLDRYALVDGSVRARLLERGDPLQSGAVLQTGILPPGSLGRLTHAALALESTRFTARVAAERGTGRQPFVVRGDDYELHGEFEGLRPDALVLWRSTRVKNKDRLRAWLHHVAMCAAREQLLAARADAAVLPETTRLLGTDGRIDAPPCSPALPRLDVLVRGYRQCRRGVLPFPPNASAAYAETLDKWQDEERALAAARRIYEPARIERQSYQHDLPDPCLELCFRDRDPIAEPEFVHWALQVFGPARTFFGAVEPHA
ncbi:MAG: exodeoxyribonuclease V subunit gamma, partial [Planctomycetota bacterium]